MIIEKNKDLLREVEKFTTYDIGLASALITLGYDISDLDKSHLSKSKFIFKRDEHIDKVVAQYWDNKLNLPARSLFENLKMLKNRLYSVMV